MLYKNPSSLPSIKNKIPSKNQSIELKRKIEKESAFSMKDFRRGSINLTKFFSNKKSKLKPVDLNKPRDSWSKKLFKNSSTPNLVSSKEKIYYGVSSHLPKLGLNPKADIEKEEYHSKLINEFGDNQQVFKKIKEIEKDKVSIEGKVYLNKLYPEKPSESISQSDSLRIIESNRGKKPKKISTENSTVSVKKKINIKVKTDFNKENEFANMIVEKYNDKNQYIPIDEQHRNIFVCLDGTVILNEKVKGYFFDIPTREELKKIPKNKRTVLLLSFLEKVTEAFSFPKKLYYMFNKDKQIILDMIDISKKDKFLLVSSNLNCCGLKIIPTLSLEKLYKEEFEAYLELKEKEKKTKTTEKRLKRRPFRVKEKKPLNQLDHSFTNDYYSEEKTEYVYYSEPDEKKKNQIKQEIYEKCYLKNDFFLYINDKESNEEINKLLSKLNYHGPVNIEKDYKTFECDYDKMLERLIKETVDTLPDQSTTMFPKELTLKEMLNNIEIHNLQSKEKYDKVYIKKKDNTPYVTQNMKKGTFYYNILRNVNKYYPHFFFFNIPKMLSLYKNFDRKNLYQVFSVYKNLVSLCYGRNKSDLILKNGIDFKTFWKCVPDLSAEKCEFVEKLFSQINRNKSKLLSFYDFFEGMSFIQNNDLKEKLDLFLKALDASGKGVLTFDEVEAICKDSIKRNMFDNKPSDSQPVLNELSLFFANFIFKLINADIKEPLQLEDIRRAIISGNVETQYLEMFCGSNNIHGN